MPLTVSEVTQALKNEPSLFEGEIHVHFSGTFQTEKTFFHPAALKLAHLFCQSPLGFGKIVVSAGSQFLCRGKQYDDTSRQDYTEFRLNHRKQLIYFNARFGWNGGSQIVLKNIPCFRIAQRKLKWNKVEIEKISSLGLLNFPSFAAFTDEITPAN